VSVIYPAKNNKTRQKVLIFNILQQLKDNISIIEEFAQNLTLFLA